MSKSFELLLQSTPPLSAAKLRCGCWWDSGRLLRRTGSASTLPLPASASTKLSRRSDAASAQPVQADVELAGNRRVVQVRVWEVVKFLRQKKILEN